MPRAPRASAAARSAAAKRASNRRQAAPAQSRAPAAVKQEAGEEQEANISTSIAQNPAGDTAADARKSRVEHYEELLKTRHKCPTNLEGSGLCMHSPQDHRHYLVRTRYLKRWAEALADGRLMTVEEGPPAEVVKIIRDNGYSMCNSFPDVGVQVQRFFYYAARQSPSYRQFYHKARSAFVAEGYDLDGVLKYVNGHQPPLKNDMGIPAGLMLRLAGEIDHFLKLQKGQVGTSRTATSGVDHATSVRHHQARTDETIVEMTVS